jgi:hypothetical protein
MRYLTAKGTEGAKEEELPESPGSDVQITPSPDHLIPLARFLSLFPKPLSSGIISA